MLMKLYRFIRSTCIITYYAHLHMLMHGWIYLIVWGYVTLQQYQSFSDDSMLLSITMDQTRQSEHLYIYGPWHQGTVNSSKLVLLEQ